MVVAREKVAFFRPEVVVENRRSLPRLVDSKNLDDFLGPFLHKPTEPGILL
jgi:hypothetical protein